MNIVKYVWRKLKSLSTPVCILLKKKKIKIVINYKYDKFIFKDIHVLFFRKTLNSQIIKLLSLNNKIIIETTITIEANRTSMVIIINRGINISSKTDGRIKIQEIIG